ARSPPAQTLPRRRRSPCNARRPASGPSITGTSAPAADGRRALQFHTPQPRSPRLTPSRADGSPGTERARAAEPTRSTQRRTRDGGAQSCDERMVHSRQCPSTSLRTSPSTLLGTTPSSLLPRRQSPASRSAVWRRHRRRPAAGVPAASGTLLMTELALTPIFSVVMYYLFAFLAISIALFGVSASGVFAYVARRRLDRYDTDAILAVQS